MKLPCAAILVAWPALCAQAPNASPGSASYDAEHRPRFEDFAVAEKWSGTPAPVQLTTSEERLYRTRLQEAGRQTPNFAGHYSFAVWRCGSNCAAGAVIDLRTGKVIPPPLGVREPGYGHWIISDQMYEGAAIQFRPDSRMVVIKCGALFAGANNENRPDAHYLVWDGGRFREVLFVPGSASEGKAAR